MWCGIRQTIYEIELTPPGEREELQHMKLRLDATEIVIAAPLKVKTVQIGRSVRSCSQTIPEALAKIWPKI